jgi:hypothetical protein
MSGWCLADFFMLAPLCNFLRCGNKRTKLKTNKTVKD